MSLRHAINGRTLFGVSGGAFSVGMASVVLGLGVSSLDMNHDLGTAEGNRPFTIASATMAKFSACSHCRSFMAPRNCDGGMRTISIPGSGTLGGAAGPKIGRDKAPHVIRHPADIGPQRSQTLELPAFVTSFFQHLTARARFGALASFEHPRRYFEPRRRERDLTFHDCRHDRKSRVTQLLYLKKPDTAQRLASITSKSRTVATRTF